MELHDSLKAFKHYFWFIFLLTALAAASAWAVSTFAMVPRYKSTTMVIISKKEYDSKSCFTKNALLDSNLITLFTRVAGSDTVALKIINELNLNMDVKRLQKLININANSQTGILDISVETTQAELSKNIIETFIRTLQSEADDLFLNVAVHTIDAPKSAEKPSSPIIPLNVGLSALGGMLAGMLLIILFSVKEQTKSDLRVLKKFPWLFVIGFMPRIRGKNAPYIFPSDDIAGEAIRMMGANLQYLTEHEGIKMVLISSSYPAEGKTTVTVNLAATMVELGRRILIVDCNYNNPSFFKIGKTGVTIGDYTVRRVSKTGFDIVEAPNDENGILYAKMRQFFETFKNSYDLILLDCPPVMTSADTLLLSQLVKNMILIADYRTVAFSALNTCVKRLARINVAVLGVIVNRMPRKKLDSRMLKYVNRSRRYI